MAFEKKKTLRAETLPYRGGEAKATKRNLSSGKMLKTATPRTTSSAGQFGSVSTGRTGGRTATGSMKRTSKPLATGGKMMKTRKKIEK